MKDVINTYGEAVIGMCAVVVAMTMIGMSMSAYRNILLGVIGSCPALADNAGAAVKHTNNTATTAAKTLLAFLIMINLP